MSLAESQSAAMLQSPRRAGGDEGEDAAQKSPLSSPAKPSFQHQGVGGASSSALADSSGSGHRTSGGGDNGLAVPLLDNPVVGQISVKKVALALKLDEARVAELLGVSSAAGAGALAPSSGRPSPSNGQATGSAFSSGPSAVRAAQAAVLGGGGAAAVMSQSDEAGLAGRLLGCFGDLFTASLDVGWKSEPDEDGTHPPKCMLTVANNDVTRVRADVESLMFQVRGGGHPRPISDLD